MCLTRNGLVCLKESKNITYGWEGECELKIKGLNKDDKQMEEKREKQSVQI